jgi:hypothetical protein
MGHDRGRPNSGGHILKILADNTSTLERKRGGGGRTYVAPHPGNIVGVYHIGMSRGEALSAPSSAAHDLIGSSNDNICGFKHDQHRERNDCTMDALTYLSAPLGQGAEKVNLALAVYVKWVGKGNSLRGAKIVASTLAEYLAVMVAFLERDGMDDPIHLTHLVQPLQKSHPLIACVIDQQTLMCVERHTHQPITHKMIDIVM